MTKDNDHGAGLAAGVNDTTAVPTPKLTHDGGLPSLAEQFRMGREYEASKWQPIDTAPKDGTWVLLYCPGGVGCVVAAYMTLDIEWWFVDTGKEEWPLRGPSPTHWMPLPEPPK